MGAIGMGSGPTYLDRIRGGSGASKREAARGLIERGGGGGRNGSSVPSGIDKPTADKIVDNTPKPKGFLRNLSKSQKYGLGAAAAVVAGLAYQKQKQSVDQRFR